MGREERREEKELLRKREKARVRDVSPLRDTSNTPFCSEPIKKALHELWVLDSHIYIPIYVITCPYEVGLQKEAYNNVN